MSSGVCLFSPYPTGGMPLYVEELVTALAASSTDGDPTVEWLSSTDLDPRFRSGRHVVHPVLPAIRDAAGFRTRIGYVVSRALHHVRTGWTLLTWLRHRTDVRAVHLQEIPTLLPDLLVCILRRGGVGVLLTVHNVRRHDYPVLLPSSVVDRWLRRAYRGSDCLFVHSHGLANDLTRFLAADGSAAVRPRIRVVPHGTWTTGGTAQADHTGLETRLASRRLLFFGTIRRNKGLHLLLEAAGRGELAGYRLTVAGEPVEPDYLERTVMPLVERARAAGTDVEIRGEFVPDDDVAALCSAHSALVLPYTDTFVAQSGVAFMGLAHGLPIVATPAGALGELLTEHHIGVLAAAHTSSAVARAIHELFSLSGNDITDLAGGMQRAAEDLTWSGMATATMEEYQRVLSRYATAVPRALGGTRCGT